jgi:hypothetical protein
MLAFSMSLTGSLVHVFLQWAEKQPGLGSCGRIPEEEWTAKREETRAEHLMPGARDELRQGFKT